MAEPVVKKVKKEKPLSSNVRITRGGKINKYCEYCMKVLGLSEDGVGIFDEITVYGEGKSLNKAITVTEILKRKYPDKMDQKTTVRKCSDGKGAMVEITLRLKKKD